MTDQPAAASTCAAVAPPGPEPITTASASRSGTTADLRVRVAAGLHVAAELDRLPARAVAVAAVLGRAVAPLAGVPVEDVLERGVGVEAAVLLVGVLVGEVVAQRGDAVAVLLLPADDRAVELALRDALGTLDAGPPRERFDTRRREELLELRVAAGAPGERAAGPDARRIERERAQHRVDVGGRAERRRAGMVVQRRDEPIARGVERA